MSQPADQRSNPPPSAEDQSSFFFRTLVVPEELAAATQNVKKFAGYFLDLNSEGEEAFNWIKFQDAIDRLPDHGIVIDLYDSTKIQEVGAAKSILLNRVANYITGVLHIGVDQESLKTKIDNIFGCSGNLTKETAGSQSNLPHLGYTYGIVFASPSGPTHFTSVVITVRFRAFTTLESYWWFFSSPRENYRVEIAAARLSVKQTFKAPRKENTKEEPGTVTEDTPTDHTARNGREKREKARRTK
ncbi:hypothetical protein RSOLAG1IB_11355 [Rhizoctonia solani AG-1 IB]|uniref:Uncharacterized protein n=1 Tax=Thanatephorus cucumeris (strain AG1-IB / isolate 7/3/14) TaxID=1108050 RepID=A0A0B7FB44_THACB|nr:hypothetical protein RSOLAG1IB_11355 [Rhizoctonia solani AG-1 IB]